MILKFIPAPMIRAAGRLQFRYPFLKVPINWIAQRLVKEGPIQRGPGKGLYFNAQGCNPGFLAGTSEPLEQELVMKHAPVGGVVYDLGANAGFYAILAARAVGARGMVYAFEPTPQLVARIRKNAVGNNFHQIEVIEAAICDRDGTVRFGVIGDLSVRNSIRAAKEGPSLTVRSITLDTFGADHLPPSLLLIDIEGAEIDALKGGMNLIRRSRPVIMVEVHWLGTKFTNFFREHLQPLGYEAATFAGAPLPEANERYHALLLPVKEAP